MAYTDTFLRLQVTGSLYGSESFAWTLALVSNFPSGGGETPATVPTGVREAVQSFHTSTSSDAAVLKTVKLNEIGRDGHYVSASNTVLYDYPTPGVAGTGSGYMPAQVALAVSLQTARARGLAHSGRFYIPAPKINLDSDGRASVASVTAITTAATTLLNALNAAVPGWRVGVASDVREGHEELVTGVRVGRVPDTMRSRRISLDEGYIVGAALAA